MFRVKYVDSIMMLVRLDLNLIVSLFEHKCEDLETVSTTTLVTTLIHGYFKVNNIGSLMLAKLILQNMSLSFFFIQDTIKK